MDKKLKILKDLKQYLQQHCNKIIVDVILFGSQVSGGLRKDSDFDILIVLEGTYTENDTNIILDLCYDIDLKYDIVIDAHLISRPEMNSLKGRQPIYNNALINGVYA